MPGPEDRKKLWRQAFAASLPMADDVDFSGLAEKYALAGGSIINVLRYCMLKSQEQTQAVSQADILQGIQREMANRTAV